MAHLIDQPSARPTRKVTGAAIGGIPLAFVISLALQAIGIPIPVEVLSAFGAAIAAGVGYLVREQAGV